MSESPRGKGSPPNPAEASGSGGEQVTVSIPEAMEFALGLHREGRLREAEMVYRTVLRLDPAQPDALHYVGLLHHQAGQRDKAVKFVRASLARAPQNASAWCNLGNLLREGGDRFGAQEAYRRALDLDPQDAAAHSNLGIALKEEGNLAEAETEYRRALAVDPSHAEAWKNLAIALTEMDRLDEAVDAFRRALALRPEGDVFLNLGYSLQRAGLTERAAEVMQQWLEQDPENPVAQHLFAALTGDDVPDRASDAYITRVFDPFADGFDEKLRNLDYRAPELVAEAIAAELGEPRGTLVALDAGCGTGLCGPFLRPYSAHLTGVDLSRGMLEKARERGGYDDLVAAELTAFLGERPLAFDLIASADTLVYFGRLEDVLGAVFSALSPAGCVVFTLEDAGSSASPAGFRLEPHGRYSHTEAYVRQVLGSVGFRLGRVSSVVLRTEATLPVAGLLVVARKPEASSAPRT